MRSPSLVEAAALVAVGGAVLASVLPTFLENLHASRLTEPIETLNHIATRATALAAGRPAEAAYPESAALTPAQVPRGELVSDPRGTWLHPTWRRLGVSFESPHAYSFAFESHNAASTAAPTADAGVDHAHPPPAGGDRQPGAGQSASGGDRAGVEHATTLPSRPAMDGGVPVTEKATFRAVAHGDLDGDGSLSTFEISGECREGSEPVVFTLTMSREVE